MENLASINSNNVRAQMVFKQKELDRDAELIKNRVSKLKQIEHKMLRKIDRTRVEADRVR